MEFAAPNHLSTRESAARGGGDGARIVRISIVIIAEVAIPEDPAVTDERIVNIDALKIARSVMVPGVVWFSPSQREPAHTDPAAEAEAAAEEAYEGGAIYCQSNSGTRAPAPPATIKVPTAIVKGSEAPRFVVNPGPAPRADVAPIADAVGSPIRLNIVGVPNGADIGLLAPSAVVIEIGSAGHVGRNVLCRNGILFAQVSIIGPLIQAIRRRRLSDSGLDVVIGAVEHAALARLEIVGLAAGCDLAFAADNGNAGGVAVFVYVDPESAGLGDVENRIRGVHFVHVTFANFADTKIDSTFSDAHLGDSLVEIEEGKSGHAAEMNGDHAGLEFSARIFVGPELIANGHGAVQRSATPIAGTTGLDGNGTIDVTDTSDTGRRIGCVTLRGLAGFGLGGIRLAGVSLASAHEWGREAEKTREREKQAEPELAVQFGLQHNCPLILSPGLGRFRPTGVYLLYTTPKQWNPKMEKKLL